MRRNLPAAVPVLAAVLALAASGRPDAGPPAFELSRPDPALTRLFAPMAAPAGVYEVYRLPQPIDAVAAALAAADPDDAPGKWRVARIDIFLAFGAEGPYDHARLARLYTGRPVRMARAWRRTDDGIVGYTAIAPFPDASLTRLEPGTMLVTAHAGRLLDALDRAAARERGR